MESFEIILLVLAYTLLIIALFLEIICFKKNIGTRETIFFTVSILILIVALVLSHFFDHIEHQDEVELFLMFSMVLVAMTTPLNVLEERLHTLNRFLSRSIIVLSFALWITLFIGYFLDELELVMVIISLYLGLSVVFSMAMILMTQPNQRILHREKAERIFAVSFLVAIPLSILADYAAEYMEADLKIGFILPTIFVLLAGNKVRDDIQRLSLLNREKGVKEQDLINFALTPREREVALLLIKGTSYKEISEHLFISMPTVKSHSSKIYRKCNVKTRSELTHLLIN